MNDELVKRMDEAMNALSDAVNGFSYDDQSVAMSMAIQKQHRTLQQNIWRAIFGAAVHYGGSAMFDDRNKDAVCNCAAVGLHSIKERYYFRTV